VGEKRRNDLIRGFGTVRAIREATEEELSQVVPKNAAHAVYAYFHGKEDETCE
jgi:excinuclease ABC subunit C